MAQPASWLRSPTAWTVIGSLAGVFSLLVAIATLANDVSGKPADPPATTRAAPVAPVTGTPAPPAAEATSPAGARFEGQVRLDRATGVDLEKREREGRDADGANGAVDLYFAAEFLDNQLRANNSDFYADEGGAQDARSRCARLVTTTNERGAPQTVFGTVYAFSMTPGQRYCFRTSEKNLAWLRINDRTDRFVVVDVTVWDR